MGVRDGTTSLHASKDRLRVGLFLRAVSAGAGTDNGESPPQLKEEGDQVLQGGRFEIQFLAQPIFWWTLESTNRQSWSHPSISGKFLNLSVPFLFSHLKKGDTLTGTCCPTLSDGQSMALGPR